MYTLGEHFDEKAFTDEFGYGTTFPQVICDGKKLEVRLKRLSSSENKKSSPSELNKSNLEINRGF